MLFLTYWELNESISEQQRIEAAQKITAATEESSSEELDLIRWDATPDSWGISIYEAENVSAILALLATWRAAVPGFFKLTKTAPALPAEEAVSQMAELLQTLG